MAAIDLSAYNKAIKTIWSEDALQIRVAQESPFYGLVPKDPEFDGNDFRLPLQYEDNQGVSCDFDTAQAYAGNNEYENFAISTKKLYGIIKVDSELVMSTRTSKGSIVRVLDAEYEAVMRTVARRMSQQLWGIGGCAVGIVKAGSDLTSAVLELTLPWDSYKLAKGMKVQFDDTDGTPGGAAARAGTATIKSVKRSGTQALVTATVHWDDAITNPAVGDHIFPAGDLGKGIYGVPAWCPTSDPGATLFCGVDRTQDLQRLGGVRMNVVGATFEEGIKDAVMEATWLHGSKFTHGFMNPMDLNELDKQLGTKIDRTVEQSTIVNVSYPAFVVHTPAGDIKLIGDPYVPIGGAWYTRMNSWMLYSKGKAPHPVETKNGDRILIRPDADQVEMRVRCYWQLGNKCPVDTMYVQFR